MVELWVWGEELPRTSLKTRRRSGFSPWPDRARGSQYSQRCRARTGGKAHLTPLRCLAGHSPAGVQCPPSVDGLPERKVGLITNTLHIAPLRLRVNGGMLPKRPVRAKRSHQHSQKG